MPSDPALLAALEKLAATDNGAALYYLGMAYDLGLDAPKDKAKALGYFRRSADLGDPLGASMLGSYYDGESDGAVPEDPDQALKYTLIGAEAGYAVAQLDVALLYAGRRDYENAREWMRKAAAQGLPDALRAFASIHNGAAGIARDPALAVAYFRLYAKTPESSESHKVAVVEFESTLSPENKARADQIVADYRAEPTALTLRAQAGQKAARALVEAGG